MLNAVVEYLPSPADLPPIKGHDEKTGAEVADSSDRRRNFAGLAFKIATDPFVGNLAFFRCYSGVLKRGSYVYNSTKGAAGTHRPHRPHARERPRRSR